MTFIRRTAHRLGTLFGGLGTAFAVWGILRPQEWSNHSYAVLLTVMGFSYLLTFGYMVVRNEGFSMRACGQALTYLADGLFYAGSGTYLLGWRDGGISRRGLPSAFTINETAFIVSLFVTALIGFWIGIIWFEVPWFHNEKPWDGTNERRSFRDRRHGWGKKE